MRTCLLIKPDGVSKRLVGKVLSRFEEEGFAVAALRVLPPDRAFLESFYSMHRGKPFFGPFLEFMLEGPSVAAVLEREDAVARCRKIIGATDPGSAEPGTLRALFGTDNRRNLVHASDSAESARREIEILFAGEELETAKI
ncbi:MAG: nucleoside-diphosphate kinase [Elusimicrobia bacterium RIFCSPLOWO2_01_FULL_64_13]|nr:MAG: nucleoside-diphosphate kinase [Elusimicrobia bacterium RIFCSPHIGHO2_01_FULL_64_10]OGR95023.1 MAG: nucleoside-diphosphate kinase [Elusimicrobia bacterium RIFCSPLOWO2_01_FULL_64_13]